LYSNLPTIEKVLEKAVTRQLHDHLHRHNILDPLQSAYRALHSTETAILKINNDIHMTMDQGDGMLLVMLDLSAAFDTLDHGILLDRLQHLVGITGTALDWLSSYLTDRKQYVKVGGSSSRHHALNIGVPQGSVLGPLLFILYTRPLGDIFRRHGIQFHQYADDTQAYCRLPSNAPDAVHVAIKKMEDCLSDVRAWMLLNKLKLNDLKTECIVFAPKSKCHVFSDVSVRIGESSISPTNTVRNLGAFLDAQLSMDQHVANTIKGGYFHLRRISRIRCHLDEASCAKAAVAFISSRLDCHNGLLANASAKQLHKLQVLQNDTARLVTQNPRRTRATPLLAQLHWLPVRQRIQFKVLSVVHNAVYQPRAPGYVKELCRPTHSSSLRTLRSRSNGTLSVPKTKKRSSDAALCVAGPRSYNALPQTLRLITHKDSFKCKLKTHLFDVAFN
jgi:hypothetical protein